MKRWLATALLLGAALPAAAGSVRTWSVSTEEEFSTGTLNGTAIDSDGAIVLAPTLKTLWGPTSGIVWDLTPGTGGDAFVALSGPGRVIRVGRGAEPELWYEAEGEKLVAAVARDPRGGVLFGSSPDGRVFRATAAGEVEVVAETGATFIWSLAVETDGTIWVGTGLPGALLRLRDGEVETVFDAEDDPVRTILPLAAGGVLLGTGGRGRVIRLGRDDRPFVLFDADEAEIVALAARRDGTLYALAASGAKQPAGGETDPAAATAGNRIRVVATPPPDDSGNAQESPPQAEQPAADKPKSTPQTFRAPAGGALYRIAADGGVRTLWKAEQETPFDMVLAADGSLVISTGDKGRIIRLDVEGRSSRVLRIPSNHASAMTVTSAGILIGGTSDARVELLGEAAAASGSYLGEPVDAGTIADWGRLRWDGVPGKDGRVELQVRAGNTAEPDGTWSDWITLPEVAAEVAAETGLPPARWFQVRANLSRRKGASPTLRRLDVRYLPRNRAPRIAELDVQPAGVVWVQQPAQSRNRLGPLVADDPVARAAAARFQNSRVSPAVRRGYEAGARTFTWRAEDPDGDRLAYAVEIRPLGGEHWVRLAGGLKESYYSWDARSLPDGRYQVRLTAEDQADNPAGRDLSTQRVSRAFLVDNSRPSVGELQIEMRSGEVQLQFTASDPGGSVASVEIAVDGGEWRPVHPLDGIADSEEERYQLVVDPEVPENTTVRSLRVRVIDAAGNLGGDLWVADEEGDR